MVRSRSGHKSELDITKEKYNALLKLAKQLIKDTKTPLNDTLKILAQIDNSIQVEKLRNDIEELIERYELLAQNQEEIPGYT